ncbi:MAG: hypothetical protein WEG56_07195 [Chloroflexota bacterium]
MTATVSPGGAPGEVAAPDPRAAATLLADWGFLAEPDLPDRPGPAYLLVALRDRPTLRHYDPEVVDYWVSDAGRGVRRSLTRATRMPVEMPFSWGVIRIVDRLGVSNEYVSFGGQLRAAEVDGMTVAIFSSEVPLLRRGGHSQGWDDGADTLAAYFGRVLLAVDVEPGYEERAAAADPSTRYAAFIDDLVGRYRRSPALQDHDPSLWRLLRGEVVRIQRSFPDAWARRGSLRRARDPVPR